MTYMIHGDSGIVPSAVLECVVVVVVERRPSKKAETGDWAIKPKMAIKKEIINK